MTTLTNFITDKSPYLNRDLNSIFAPISTDTIQVYTNYGTLNFSSTYLYSTFNYYPMANMKDGNINSFTVSNPSINIVTTGIEGGASFIKFPNTGIYNLKMLYSYKFGYDRSASSGYQFNMYMRIMDSNNTNESTIPTYINFSNFLDVSINGNSSNENNITTLNPNNSLFMYNLNSNNNQGYYVFQPLFYTDSNSGAYTNIYSIDMTFIVLIPELKIYPQYYINYNTTASNYWQWVGKWSVTKVLSFGLGSLLSNGTSYASGNSSTSITSNDLYTIEFFLLVNSNVTSSGQNFQSVLSLGGATNRPFIKYITSDGTVKLELFNNVGSISTTPIVLNTWYHIAFTRNNTSNEFSVFLNGQLQTSAILTNAEIKDSTIITIASFYNVPSYPTLRGNITNIRITKKVVYTGNFTVPQVPLQVTQPAGTNIAAINNGECISLLQCYGDTLLLDSVSGANFTNINLVYSIMAPAFELGSLLSNGTSYASGNSSTSITSNDLYTIEFFLLVNSNATSSGQNYQSVLSLGGATNRPFIKYITSDGTVKLELFNNVGSISTSSIVLNTWYHIAFTRNNTSNDFSVFLNGQLQTSAILTNAEIKDSTIITIASFYNAPSYPTLRGNITNIRITKKVVYTGNFTVPQVPLQVTQPASTNIAAINNGECISLLQCYGNTPLLDSVSGANFTNINLVYSTMKPST
jgi:hypothetical protein